MRETATPQFAELAVGQEITQQSLHITRDSLVRYAGASGDFNPIHYRDDIAREVGLDGVLAHGMLTMGLANSVLGDWLGTGGYIKATEARFTRPVVVDPQTGAELSVTATIAELDPAAQCAKITLKVTCEAKTVLAKSQAWVQFVSRKA